MGRSNPSGDSVALADADAVSRGEGLALKPRLKALSTAVYLDTGSAIALVQEAVALFEPVLQYVALGDVPV